MIARQGCRVIAALALTTTLARADLYRRGEPETFDPQKTQTVIVYDLFEGLLACDAEGKLVPGVERPTPYVLGLLAHQTAVPLDRAAVETAARDAFKPDRLVSNGASTRVGDAPN